MRPTEEGPAYSVCIHMLYNLGECCQKFMFMSPFATCSVPIRYKVRFSHTFWSKFVRKMSDIALKKSDFEGYRQHQLAL